MILIDDQYVEPAIVDDGLTKTQLNQLNAWIKAKVRGKNGKAESHELYAELQSSASPAWHKLVRVDVFEQACQQLQADWDAKRPKHTP